MTAKNHKSSATTDNHAWKIGYAQTDITPKAGQTLMSGYGKERYATGKLTPLRAQAIAVVDRLGNKAVIVTADVLGFDRVGVRTLREAIGRQFGITPDALILAASHTHWGPSFSFRFNFSAGGHDSWYRKSLEESLVRLVGEALGSLCDGGIEYTSIDAAVGCNRRVPDGKGGVLWGPYPQGGYDTHTPILKFTRADSPRTIVVAGHACHPTSTGDVPKWAADYPGAMRAHIEKTLGADARAAFVMGCGADAKVTHPDPKTGQPTFSADPKLAAAAGRKLGAAVLKKLKSGALETLPSELRTRLVVGDLSFAKPLGRALVEAMAFGDQSHYCDRAWARQLLSFPDSRKALPYEVQAWGFGDVLTLISLEGETCHPLGPLARGFSRTKHAMIVGYANATEGYIPSKTIVKEGGYEGESSHRAYFLPAPFTPRVEKEFGQIVANAIGR